MDGPLTDLSDAKARLAAEVDRRHDVLVDLSRQITHGPSWATRSASPTTC